MKVLSVALLITLIGQNVRGNKYLSGNNTNKEEAVQFMNYINNEANVFCDRRVDADFKYRENKTDENKKARDDLNVEYEKFLRATWQNSTTFAWKYFKLSDPTMYRWFKLQSTIGDVALPEKFYEELNNVTSDMLDTYDKAKVCNESDSCETPTLSMVPELDSIMMHSKDYDELSRVWSEWRKATGRPIREKFFRYIELKNEVAKQNGFINNGKFWQSQYETKHLQSMVERLWNQILPFYQQLHAYVRRKLMQQYPGKIQPGGPIPANILGNMWAATWMPIFDLLQPFPSVNAINVTVKIQEKGLTPLQMFQTAEEFFTSMGLKSMTPGFWKHTLMVKTDGEEAHCNAYASVICNGRGTRIYMCTRAIADDFYIVHHEMGHVEYFLHVKDLPIVFQGGANPAFHEAIGDAIALSVNTPTHLKSIGLIDEVVDNTEADLNYMMQTALDKVAFLPFGYLMDRYRWEIFEGKIDTNNLNTKWWEMELKYQGICPPTKRTEIDFDAASLFHVPADVEYLRYFFSFIIQFQFYKALCTEAGHVGPLHKCDFYNNKGAGKLLADVLSKGNSIPWPDVMSILTKGQTKEMKADAILEYFDPLIKWLKKENEGQIIGWNSNDPTICP